MVPISAAAADRGRTVSASSVMTYRTPRSHGKSPSATANASVVRAAMNALNSTSFPRLRSHPIHTPSAAFHRRAPMQQIERRSPAFRRDHRIRDRDTRRSARESRRPPLRRSPRPQRACSVGESRRSLSSANRICGSRLARYWTSRWSSAAASQRRRCQRAAERRRCPIRLRNRALVVEPRESRRGNDEIHDLMHDRDRGVGRREEREQQRRDRATRRRDRSGGAKRSGVINAASVEREHRSRARRSRTERDARELPRAPASSASGRNPHARSNACGHLRSDDIPRVARASRRPFGRRRTARRERPRRRPPARRGSCPWRSAPPRAGIDHASPESCAAYVPAGSSRSLASAALAVSTNAVQSMLVTRRKTGDGVRHHQLSECQLLRPSAAPRLPPSSRPRRPTARARAAA